jgi:hypothetical protein
MGADVGELRAWAKDLGEAAEDLIPQARKVLVRGVINIKRDAKRRIGRPAAAPYYAASITDDVRQGGDYVEVEVGPDKNRRQGALGNLLEFGSVNNGPIPHMAPATDKELPVIERYLDGLVAELLE